MAATAKKATTRNDSKDRLKAVPPQDGERTEPRVDWADVGNKVLKGAAIATAVGSGIISGKRRAEDPFADLLSTFFGSTNPTYAVTSEASKTAFKLAEMVKEVRNK